MDIKLEEILNVLKHFKYKIYTEPYRLNIVGFRFLNFHGDKFDDMLLVHRTNRNKGKSEFYSYPITTFPGIYYLKNPISKTGTGILLEGQYVDTYSLDLHQNKYLALCQRLKPVKVIRDVNKNDIPEYSSNIETGMFGINIHRARLNSITTNIGKHSAGCQVFSSSYDYEEFIKMCMEHKELYGNKFTYTLINDSDYYRFSKWESGVPIRAN